MEVIKQTIKDMLEAMGFKEVNIDIKKQETDEILIANIQMEEASRLIGQNGLNLCSLQHILRLMVRKKDPQAPRFILDINNYREKRKEFLKELAHRTALEVAKSKKSIILHPMSSFERRIIHLELAERPDIVTESIGEEPERRVAVRPYP